MMFDGKKCITTTKGTIITSIYTALNKGNKHLRRYAQEANNVAPCITKPIHCPK